MKRLHISLAVAILITGSCFGQNVGIGTTIPNASSILEIKSSNKGLLIPRTSTGSRTAIVSPAKGLLVFDTTTSSFWFHSGSAWTQIEAGSGTNWSTIGNADTDSSVNFIGTTDAQALIFKVNNLQSGFLGYSTANTSFGYNALTAITSGNYNTANGTGSLLANTTGYNNTASGSYALATNSGGSFNVAAGSDALHNNISGYANNATGFQSLFNNQDGHDNTGFGNAALFTNISGSGNIGIGNYSLYYNTASNNTAEGFQTLYNNNTGYSNTANGFSALYHNVAGHSNVATGDHALFNNIGSNNVGIGDSVLYNNGIGTSPNDFYANNNTAIGSKALYSNTQGFSNVASGYQALYSNTTGHWNAANGYQALYSNSSSENTASGYQALYSNTTGYDNTAIGTEALYFNTTGFYNTASGANALKFNTTGTYNTANGTAALSFNTAGNYNTANGYYALESNTTGNYNTACGYQALTVNTTGINNTAVGVGALNLNINDDNTALGYYADVAVGMNNSTALGQGAFATGPGQVMLGNTSVTSVKAAGSYVIYSDGRYKKDLKEDVPGLEFIEQLRPVTYYYDIHGMNNKMGITALQIKRANSNVRSAGNTKSDKIREDAINAKEKKLYTGFVAQEVEAAAMKLKYDFSGIYHPENDKDLYGLSYAEFVVPLVKAVQEQQQIIDTQKKDIDQLKSQVAGLTKTINKLLGK